MKLLRAAVASAAALLLCAQPALAEVKPVGDTTPATSYTTTVIIDPSTGEAITTFGGGGSGGSGTEYTEDGVATANPVGGTFQCVRRDTLTVSEVSADGDWITCKATSKGQLHVAAEILNSTLAITASALPLPSGAATSANQTTLNGYVDGLEGAAGTTADAAWTTGSGSMISLLKTIAGAAIDTSAMSVKLSQSGTDNDIDITSSALPTGAATSANQTTLNGYVDGLETLLSNLTGTKAAGTAAANSALMGCVYNSSAPTLTSGQQVALQCDVNGQIKTSGSGGGGGAVTVADGSDQALGAKADSAWTSGSGSAIALLKAIAGAALDTTASSVKFSQSSTDNDVDITSSALPTGAATSANQTTLNGYVDGLEGYLDGVEGLLGGTLTVGGNVAHDGVDTGNPVKIGGKARTAQPTAVADGDRTDASYDAFGRALVSPAIRAQKAKQFTTITASTSETTIVTAAGAGVFADLYGLVVTNTSASDGSCTIKDATGGSTVAVIAVKAGLTGGFAYGVGDAMPQATANNNWTATCTSLSSWNITASFVKTAG